MNNKKKSKLKSFDENIGMHLNKVKIVLVLIVILFISSFCAVRFLPIFSVKNIEVNGNEIVTDDTIIELCGINYNSNLYGLNKNLAIGLIKSNAYIESATITRKLPDTLVIDIEERKPLFVIQKENEFVYLDMHGNILDIKDYTSGLPVVYGFKTNLDDLKVGNKISKEDFNNLDFVYKLLETIKIKQISSSVTRIDIEDTNNSKIWFDNESKVAYIGNGSELDIRLDYIKAILAQELGNSGSIFVNIDLNKGKAYFREEEIETISFQTEAQEVVIETQEEVEEVQETEENEENIEEE